MPRLKRNIVSNILGQGLLLLIGLMATKLIYHQLGDDGLGIIYFAIMLNGMIAVVAGLGIQPTVIRQVAAHQNRDDDYVHKLIQTASFIFWIIYALVIMCVYYAMPAIVEHWVNLSDMEPERALYVLRILCISSLLAIPQSLYKALFDGMQRMDVRNGIEVVSVIIQQAGIVAILYWGGDIELVSEWIAVYYCLLTIALITVSIRFVPERSALPLPHLDIIKRNARFSLRMATVSLLALLHTQADKFFVSKFLPVGALGYYSVVHNILSKLTFVAMQVAKAAFPQLCEMHERKAFQESLARYDLLQELICYGSIPMVSAILYFHGELFTFLFDASVAESITPVVLMLSVAMFLQLSFMMTHYFVLAQGQERLTLHQSAINVLVSLPTALLAIYYLGLNGAGLAFLLSRLFVLAYAVPIVARECFQRSTLLWLRPLLGALLLGLVSYGAVYGLMKMFIGYGGVESLVAYMVATMLFLLMAWRRIIPSLRSRICVEITKYIPSWG